MKTLAALLAVLLIVLGAASLWAIIMESNQQGGWAWLWAGVGGLALLWVLYEAGVIKPPPRQD